MLAIKLYSITRLGQNRNILDLVLVNEVRLVSRVEHCSPIANSDHETLFFTLYVGIENENENDVNYTYDLAKGNCQNEKYNSASRLESIRS